jgi:hypothetical protein
MISLFQFLPVTGGVALIINSLTLTGMLSKKFEFSGLSVIYLVLLIGMGYCVYGKYTLVYIFPITGFRADFNTVKYTQRLKWFCKLPQKLVI